MNGRERLLTAIQGGTPDRVPVTLFIQDQGHFLNQMAPEIDPLDYQALQLKVIELQRRFGADVMVRVLFGLNDPLSIHMGGLNVSRETEHWEVKRETLRRGSAQVERCTIRTPEGVLTQETSRTEIRPGTFLYACPEKPVKTPRDLELAIRYEPGMPDSFPEHARQWIAPIRQAVGGDGIVAVWAPHGPFNNASLLIDQETLYSLFMIDPGYYARLMNFAMERILGYARAMAESGADLLCVGGNVPGGFLGRRVYDEYILPYEQKYIEFLQRGGTPAMYHNCGQLMALVESYKELGVRVVEPFSPPPLGDGDLRRAKELVGGAYAILGGVDQVNVIQKGTPDAIRRQTESQMRAGKPGGGFILQSADFLEYGTPEENVALFIKTALDVADY